MDKREVTETSGIDLFKSCFSMQCGAVMSWKVVFEVSVVRAKAFV